MLGMANDFILGTAGHIDHGKTALVRALTGVDTDRLPEEKRRGITIELGFASLDLGDSRLGIVDVPGHERFVRNMLAGASGIDLALLVVASDDSVKPQTREHFEILRLLDLRAGVIALTKCDLSEPSWIDMVEEELHELVAGTFLEEAPIIRTSTETGQGIDELRKQLTIAAGLVAESLENCHDGPFRMAIDRAFTIEGHGTVVTGSVANGSVAVGDPLRIEPNGADVRVRELQHHDETVDRVQRGQRAAINLAGAHHTEIERGQVVASPGHLVPSRLLSVELQLLASAAHPLKHRSRVRVHLGTAEVLANVSLLEGELLAPGEEGVAQLFLSEPVVCTWRQPLVLRLVSPVVTIGGGHVLDPNAMRLKRENPQMIERVKQLNSDDSDRRALASAYFLDVRPWQAADLSRTAAVPDPQSVVDGLVESGELKRLVLSRTRTQLVHSQAFEEWLQRVEKALARLHELNPLQLFIESARLSSRFSYLADPPLVQAMLDELHRQGRIRLAPSGIAMQGHGPQLSKGEKQLLEELVEIYHQAGLQPPNVKAVQGSVSKNRAVVPRLVELAAAQGRLVKVTTDMYLHSEAEQGMRTCLEARFAATPELTIGEIRDLLQVSRKQAVPLCEYLDRIGFTRREGDKRVRNPGAGQS